MKESEQWLVRSKMGVQLSGLIKPREIEFKELSGKRIAIDAYNALYQFLSIIRQPTGEPLMDRRGKITSHLSGLLYRNANLLDFGVMPAYVFDGKPPEFKKGVIDTRIETRKDAAVKWKAALERGEMEEARIYAGGSSQLSDYMIEDSKRLLTLMGIPVVQAPSEGEAQGAHMTARGTIWAAASQDYDSLLFGTPRLLRNIAISGKRKLPRKNVYVTIKPELFETNKIFSELEISREQLIELSILIGTDYNPKGIEGLGPKKAFKIIKEHGSLEASIKNGVVKPFDFSDIKGFFLKPPVTDDYELKWDMPDESGILDFLCGERDFSKDRVFNAIEKIKKGMEESASQSSLDVWI